MLSLRTRSFQALLTAVAAVYLAECALVFLRPADKLAHWRALQTATMDGTAPPGLKWEAVAPSMLELYASAGICAGAVALILALVWRAARRPEARLLAVFLSCLFTPGLLLTKAGFPLDGQVLLRGALAWLAVGSFVRFAALFPRRVTRDILQQSVNARALAKGREARILPDSEPRILRPAVVWGIAAAGAAATVAARLGGVVWVEGVASLALIYGVLRGLGLMRASYRVADAAGRRQMLWAVQGFYAAAWATGLAAVPAALISARAGYLHAENPVNEVTIPYAAVAVQHLAGILAIGLIVLGLGVAVLYRGALDPALALKRTTIYGVLTVTGALLFGIVENLASSLLADVLHLSEGVGAAVSGAVVALALGPIRAWITRVVERRVAPSEPEPAPAELAGA